ncbi:MAG: hypothetical protein QGH51_00225 [Planctomycetota bacterium]|nr:hypothetical protein [Planctomycetota bacterium]MDP6940432.1 hypothetical protein [Planctomycetota bacterium]
MQIPVFSMILTGLALCLPSGALYAQNIIQLNDFTSLPMKNAYTADHAVVALNSRGDAFVVWDAQIKINGSSPRKFRSGVQGVFMRRTSLTTWSVPSKSSVITLGDPNAFSIGSDEKCHKPDIIAQGNNFVVTWPRIELISGNSRLEAVEISVHPQGPIRINRPDSFSGIGWVVEDGLTSGDAGIMPDLVRVDPTTGFPSQVAAVYSHSTSISGSEREYEIRLTGMDFSVSPPNFTQPQTLVQDVCMDDHPAGLVGGRVLPDAVSDDYGNLVLAWENFKLAGHQGAPTDLGFIQVTRFSLSSGCPIALETNVFYGLTTSSKQRRPMLSTSHADSRNSVSLSWGEVFDAVADDATLFCKDLEYLNPSTTGSVTISDSGFSNLPGWQAALPIPLTGKNLRYLFSNHYLAGQTPSISAFQFGTVAGMEYFPQLKGIGPRRVSVDLLEMNRSSIYSNRILALAYEAARGSVNPYPKIFVGFTSL